MMSTDHLWKHDWPSARGHHIKWWDQQGMVLWITAPKDKPWEDIPRPAEPRDAETRWYDAQYRFLRAEYELSRTYFGADAFPMAPMWGGAGDLAAYLGCAIEPRPDTIWFKPCISDPLTHPPLRFNPRAPVYVKTMAMVDYALAHGRGRFFVSQPDIIENIDILSALRGPQDLMMDLIEHPEWVQRSVAEITQAFYTAFEAFYQKIKDREGGNTFVFNLWGPGRTCKVQCDACAMFGPALFRKFVAPALTEQCRWLDYAMYHLDGTQAVVNLDELLAIEPLRAIEWTPQSGLPRADDPCWFELYRRVLRAGKSIQPEGVAYDRVIPLLDALGPKGVFINTRADSEEKARALEEKVAAYR